MPRTFIPLLALKRGAVPFDQTVVDELNSHLQVLLGIGPTVVPTIEVPHDTRTGSGSVGQAVTAPATAGVPDRGDPGADGRQVPGGSVGGGVHPGTQSPPPGESTPKPVEPTLGERAIQWGMQFVGMHPYTLGGRCGRSSWDCVGVWDCSSFVNLCFHKAGATWNLPQTGLLANNLPHVAPGDLRRGDIMVMAAPGEPWGSVVGAHTGIWLGDGNLLQCGSLRDGVGVWGPVPGWPHVFVRGDA